MNSVLTIQKYLAINRGRYLRKMVKLPKVKSNIYVNTHLEKADTDLLHYHETAHLSFVLKGEVIDKRKNVRHKIHSGELMFFRAGEQHQTIYQNFPAQNINIEFESSFFSKNGIDETKLSESLTKTPDSKFSMIRIFRELSVNDEFSDSSIEMLLLGLINETNFCEKKTPDWLKKIVELLHDRWNEDISLDELAVVANVHPKTISKYFPVYFKCTLGEYRRKLRVEKSLSLIQNSNLSLTEIAYQCGFYDQSHFTATFKHLTGSLPKQFQKCKF